MAGRHRLLEVLIGTSSKPTLYRLKIGPGRQQEYRYLGRVRAPTQFLAKFEAGNARHHHVQNDQVRLVLGEYGKGAVRITRSQYREAFAPEDNLHQGQLTGFI